MPVALKQGTVRPGHNILAFTFFFGPSRGLNIEVKKRVSEPIPGEEITPGESNSIRHENLLPSRWCAGNVSLRGGEKRVVMMMKTFTSHPVRMRGLKQTNKQTSA